MSVLIYLPSVRLGELRITIEAYIPRAKKLNTVAVVRKRTIPTERPPHFGEIVFWVCMMSHE
jgi:hypothetical protein